MNHSDQVRRLLAIMRQAETTNDLHEFSIATQTQAIARALPDAEQSELADEYDLLRLRLRGRVKFDALAGRRVIVTAATRPYYDEKQGADMVELIGLFDDGRSFRATSAAPNVVRFFAQLRELPSPDHPRQLLFYRIKSATNPNLWKVRDTTARRQDASATNPFREGPSGHGTE